MQVRPAFSSRSGSTSVWHRIRQLTPMSRARRIISGWSPQMTMLSGSPNSRFSQLWGRAMTTLPDTVSIRSPLSLSRRPSMTLSRLNRGTASTRGLAMVVML